MADRTCSVNGCERTNYAARGWCWLHYKRWRSYGDPLATPPPRRIVPLEERMWRHIRVTDDGCWEWTAHRNHLGYGRVQVDGSCGYSHREMYALKVGPIPDGMHLDHLCRNQPCCNPDHLEPVTPQENVRRGQGNGSQTHCPEGHPYEGENLYVHKGRRYCRTCNIRRSREWREQRAS